MKGRKQIEKKNVVLTIKYKQQEQGKNEYIELNVANFPYSFPDFVEEKRFQEQMKLNNGASVYFKNKDDFERRELNISCCIIMSKRMMKM